MGATYPRQSNYGLHPPNCGMIIADEFRRTHVKSGKNVSIKCDDLSDDAIKLTLILDFAIWYDPELPYIVIWIVHPHRSPRFCRRFVQQLNKFLPLAYQKRLIHWTTPLFGSATASNSV